MQTFSVHDMSCKTAVRGDRAVARAERAAENAEFDAEAAVTFAVYALQEAEYYVLPAAVARADADAADRINDGGFSGQGCRLNIAARLSAFGPPQAQTPGMLTGLSRISNGLRVWTLVGTFAPPLASFPRARQPSARAWRWLCQ
jgi:hypothetical protein